VVIEPQFSRARRFFTNGVVDVQMERGGKWGCIDKTGRFIVPPIFESASYLSKQRIVYSASYYYDVEGNKLDHYVNHMEDGYRYMENKDYTSATASFRAALKINPDDKAALYGLEQVQLGNK
jgi:hypothetical protein